MADAADPAGRPEEIGEGTLRQPFADPLAELMSRRLLWCEPELRRLAADNAALRAALAAAADRLDKIAHEADAVQGVDAGAGYALLYWLAWDGSRAARAALGGGEVPG